MSEYGRFDTVVATFRPTRTDDLQDWARPHVGWRGRWRAVWTIDEEDGGPYVGQMAFMPDELAGFGWAPEEDLADVELTREGSAM